MKKILSLMLAAMFSFVAMAQNTYFQGFETDGCPSDWSVSNVTTQDWWFEYNQAYSVCAAGEQANHLLLSPEFTLSSDNASGELSLNVSCYTDISGVSSAAYGIGYVVDGDYEHPTYLVTDTVMSTRMYMKHLSFPLSQLNLTSTPHTYQFVIWHIGQASLGGSGVDGALEVDDFFIRFKANAFMVSFDPDDQSGATGYMDPISTAEADSSITFPDCSFTAPTGKVFAYWECYSLTTGNYEISVLPGDYVTGIESDIVAYAIWGLPFTVNYNANGGTGTMASDQGVQYLDYLVVGNEFRRPGYTFTGWNTAADGSGDSYSAGDYIMNTNSNTGNLISTSITLYAQWMVSTGVTYTLSFNNNGGTGSMANYTAEANESYTLPACTFTRQGYTFLSWNTAADGTGEAYMAGSAYMVFSDMTFYAQWVENGDTPNPPASSYTMSFVGNGGSGSMASQSVTAGQSFTLPGCSFTYSDHTFQNWNTMPNGQGVTYAVGSSFTPTSDMTFYAIWQTNGGSTPDPVTFTIHYAANGGSGSMTDGSVQEGDYYTVKACSFTRSGYSFLTWNTQPDGTGTNYPAGSEISITSNITLYAIWDENGSTPEVTTYTVRYNANGGNGTMNNSTYQEGDFYTVRACSFTREGYSFAYWTLNPDGTGSHYYPGEEVDFGRDVTLYAFWTANSTQAIQSVAMANVSVYPNPARNVITVNGTNASRIEVLDLSGRTLLSEQGNTINIGRLANGVYTLRIIADEGSTLRRIVKQ